MTTDSTGTRRAKNKGIAAGLTVGLLGGTAAGLAFGVPGLSSAAANGGVDGGVEAIVQQVDDTGTDTAARPDPGQRLREVLQPLVDDGTITAEQADAVTSQLVENRPEREPGERRRGPRGQISEAVLELLGVDAETLRAELRDGSSLADIATENGVNVQQVIDAIVADASERLDEAVTNGRIDETEATDKLAQLEERVTARVNGEHPAGPREVPAEPGG